ncbi:alpha-D-ribose 1-methylphosphonate 5-triphosphate diphosphatase [Ilumatobacter sp.]|uniref:alpha-D-ribose 1-methylphosphonate 5-triphosphate diphosphatase n=1 Tax=Ilumatobacter sp. TaxID=1967498 RepID=UPI003C6B37A5
MDTILHPRNFAITDVTAVLPDRLIEHATVVVADGIIESVDTGSPPPGALDGRGALLAPGVVDTHSDGLEKELRPRPGVLLPMDFAIHSFEGRVRGAGVTTIFHGIGFENGAKYDRSVEQATAMCAALAERAGSGAAPIDHRILHRLDVRDADGFVALRDTVDRALGQRPLVSYEDHTPGQGQYADRRWMERYIAGTRDMEADQAKDYIDEVIADRDRQRIHRDEAMPWLGERGRAEAIRLMCHDPADVGDIDEAVAVGASIAEFPTTVEAAVAARERGLQIVCGAPNALRGESHSGNVSARELIGRGLCDSLASDYMPSTLLGAVGRLVADHVCALPDAIRLVTSGAAATVGLDDRGRLAPGQRADLVLFDLRGALPTVRLAIGQSYGASTPTMVPTPDRGELVESRT